MKRKIGFIIIVLLINLIFLFLYYENAKKENQIPEKENIYSINVNDAGAIGDGKADDTKIIQKAINQVSPGGNIILDSGSTYRITDTIIIEKDISIISHGKKKAAFLMDNNEGNKPILNFNGEVKHNIKDITSTFKQRDISIPMFKKNGIRAGDLILIESDTPWYFDPRTGTENLHKGELHRISGVTNTKILLEEALWDSYLSKYEDINVKIIRPIQVNIKNINLLRSESNNRTIGLRIKYCSNCVIDNTSVKNSSALGIHIVSSYRTSIEDSTIEGANDKNSGYGIQSYGSSFSLIRDNVIFGSRRGVDISGLYPDHYSIVEFNSVFGGGKNKIGQAYLIEDTQYGIGTHSTANFTTFRGNILGNLNYGINIRSANTSIEQNHFMGYIKGSCIILSNGRNVIIKENRTTSGKNLPNFADMTQLPTNIKEFKASTFLAIKRSFEIDSGFIKITNNSVDISSELIKILDSPDSKLSSFNQLNIEGNRIKLLDNKNGKSNFFLINSDFPLFNNSTTIKGNKVTDMMGNIQDFRYKNFKP
ncbi:hypothetical protein ABE67_23130 [Cytobacillus firmus]|uniref:glycosyl hydrolase family 28-related protein n=1 Tax=Cytobacillus firmus TaxID=1399 RepID=UPI0018CCD5A5|nr:glycosyl hydrolase family 28-related protein [Cytobacillus firmus]MBG9452168.1 hypothetical protein [Cytobacillus firmus]